MTYEEKEASMTDAAKLYDAVIIGGGPAGLTAALYLARARYRVLVVEKDRFGGQITITDEVVNYPGVFSTSGAELTETMRKQAESFGAEFLLAEVTALEMGGDVKQVKTSKGTLDCYAVLLATGASPRRAGFEGEGEFQGHGVAYCATCDGEFFTDKQVFVVGGGFAAAEEAVFLTKYASHVTIVVRKEDFSCAPSASEAAKNHPKIDVRYNTRIASVAGDAALRSLVLEDTKTGEQETYRAADGDTFGVFVFAGYAPATQLVSGIAETNEAGYILTDDHQATTCPGLYAAGDVCVKPLRQVATAVGEAATTATEMERYIKQMQETVGIVPQVTVPDAPVAAKGAAAKSDDASAGSAGGGALFTEDMVAQLNTVFGRMESALVLRLHLDGRPVSSELRAYAHELSSLTDKISLEEADTAADDADQLPYVEICRTGGEATGLAFHGVPGGHEFTSFVLGLYNAAGPGQPIDDADRSRIAAIARPVKMQVLVGLSCTMCPELVTAAQRIAADNANVAADVYDIAHFPGLKDTYNVMSVPCLVVNDGAKVSFGKKTLPELLDYLEA